MVENNRNISIASIIGPACRERFLPLQLSEAAPLRERGVCMGGISRLVPPYEIERRQASYHSVLCTTAGAGVWTSASRQGEIVAGSVWLFPAGSKHHYTIAGPRWAMHWVHLDEAAGWHCAGGHPRLIGPLLPGLEEAMRGVIGEEHSAVEDTAAVRHAYVALLLVLLERLLGGAERVPVDSMALRLSRLWQTVAGDLRYAWTVDALAGELHVSPAHLHRLTREHYDATPMQRVTAQRMEHAKMLVQHTDYTLAMIADRTGYQTPFAFSKAFKRWAGMSPRQLRQGEGGAQAGRAGHLGKRGG
jgi:AraC-like DNA-binding protein